MYSTRRPKHTIGDNLSQNKELVTSLHLKGPPAYVVAKAAIRSKRSESSGLGRHVVTILSKAMKPVACPRKGRRHLLLVAGKLLIWEARGPTQHLFIEGVPKPHLKRTPQVSYFDLPSEFEPSVGGGCSSMLEMFCFGVVLRDRVTCSSETIVWQCSP